MVPACTSLELDVQCCSGSITQLRTSHTPSPVCGLDTVHTALCGFGLELLYDPWTSFVRFQFMLGDEIVDSALLESSSRGTCRRIPNISPFLSLEFSVLFHRTYVLFIKQKTSSFLPNSRFHHHGRCPLPSNHQPSEKSCTRQNNISPKRPCFYHYVLLEAVVWGNVLLSLHAFSYEVFRLASFNYLDYICLYFLLSLTSMLTPIDT